MVYVTAVKNLVDKKGTLGRRWYRNKKKKKTKGGEWESGGRKEERGKRDRENRRAD